MKEKQQLAQHLYMTQGMSQKQIALEVGVSERTIYSWIHQFAWDKLKRAAYQAPAIISQNFCSQLVEMQNAIAARDEGNRYPSPQEAEVMRKLVVCIEKMKKYPAVSQTMQMLETFKNYMRPIDKEFTAKLSNYSERFLTGSAVNGFVPHDLEYGVSHVAPVMPFYEEPEDTGSGSEGPCNNLNDCKHIGSCTYPHCTRSQRDINETSPDPLTRNGVVPIPAITEDEHRKDYNKYMTSNGFHLLAPPSADPALPQQTGSIPAITKVCSVVRK